MLWSIAYYWEHFASNCLLRQHLSVNLLYSFLLLLLSQKQKRSLNLSFAAMHGKAGEKLPWNGNNHALQGPKSPSRTRFTSKTQNRLISNTDSDLNAFETTQQLQDYGRCSSDSSGDICDEK